MAKFDEKTREALAGAGYKVGVDSATKKFASGVVAKVLVSGGWWLKRGSKILESGRCSHPCLAACDANEAGWKCDKEVDGALARLAEGWANQA